MKSNLHKYDRAINFTLNCLMVVMFFLIVAMFYTCFKFQLEQVTKDKTMFYNSKVMAKTIYEARREGESCKELNMNMYVWLRSQGYHPDVQIGTKDGKGHLWLQVDSKIIDVTDPTYFGKNFWEVKDVYKLDDRELVK